MDGKDEARRRQKLCDAWRWTKMRRRQANWSWAPIRHGPQLSMTLLEQHLDGKASSILDITYTQSLLNLSIQAYRE